MTGPEDAAPPALVVVGAALGTGRWLAEHLLPHAEWSSIALIDSKTTKTGLATQSWRLAESGAPIVFGESVETAGGDRVVLEGTDTPLPLPSGPTVAIFALPAEVCRAALAELGPLLSPETEFVVVSSELADALKPAVAAAHGRAVVGLHALFDTAAPSLAGQILYVASAGLEAPDAAAPQSAGAGEWLVDATARAGGILKSGSAAEHDAAMAIVQRLAHRTLLDFADAVTASELDLERDLWEARTPLFETLFGLAVRVLDSRATTLPATAVAAVQDRIPGALYDTIKGTAAAAVTAAQARRLRLAALWRSGELVGLGPSIGRIVDLTPTTVTIEHLLAGPAGGGVLLDGPGARNAAALGVAGSPKRVTLALGHAEPVVGAELDALLDERLAVLRRDVRFLVPESIAGDGVLRVVAESPSVRGAELRDEVVRTGQRAVVIRVGIRADDDPQAVIAALQEHVAAAYRWPAGLALEAAIPVARVAYLGPAGTFSEDAAGLAAAALGAPGAALDPLESFDEVLAAVAGANDAAAGTVGVLPLTSSASGLVSRAVAALLAGPAVVAGGIVDVAVRFDAYALPGLELDALRGAPVFSHPQALAQCGAFVRRWGLDPQPVESTAAALERAATAGAPAVALAGAGKGGALGLAVAEREVDDLSGSITRFLILGAPGAFGAFRGGSQPTLRRVRIGDAEAVPVLGAGAAFHEVLTDADGRWLVVTSNLDGAGPGVLLGDVPWSPRTPVVRA